MPTLTRLESELRQRARELIQEGRLPDRAPARVWGGPGSGAACSLCGETIPSVEMEYEADAAVGGTVQTLHFHFVCHAAWQLECLRADFDTQRGTRSTKAPTAPRGSRRTKPSGNERWALGWRAGWRAGWQPART